MVARALKKVEFPDPVSQRSSGPVRTAPLSTFSFGQDDPTARLRQRLVTYALAAILELALLATIWIALGTQTPAPPETENSAIEMVEAPPQPQPVPPKLLKIETPRLKPAPVRQVPQMRLAIDRILPIPAPQAAMPDPQPPAPPPPAPAASAEAVDRFQAAVRAAIQAAIVYPPAARMMNQQGRAKVAFTLESGHAENPRIAQSSGIPAIDTAAIAAVRDAAYPAPPRELAGKPLAFAVFVEFNLAAH